MPIRKVTVSRNDSLYELVPDIARLPNGKLICVYRESDGHTVRTYSDIAYRTSMDGGETWSERSALVEAHLNADDVVLKWNCPRIQRLSDGRLLILCDVFPSPPDERTDLRESHVVFWFSDDEGLTWSEPRHTNVYGIVPDRVVELPSGDWLLATHLAMEGDVHRDRFAISGEGPKLAEIAFRSSDQGKSWEGPVIVGRDPRYNLCEGSILQLPDGELVCYLRETSGRNIPGMKAFSTDEGRTWDGVYPTPMDGCHRPVTGILPSGRILTTYRYRQPGTSRYHAASQSAEATWNEDVISYWARNTFAYLETEESSRARKIEDQGGIIRPIDFDRSKRSDGGYTGWVVLHDGTIFCVNYIVDDAPMAQIRGYWFREEDF